MSKTRYIILVIGCLIIFVAGLGDVVVSLRSSTNDTFGLVQGLFFIGVSIFLVIFQSKYAKQSKKK
jgi:hypothetical protein